MSHLIYFHGQKSKDKMAIINPIYATYVLTYCGYCISFELPVGYWCAAAGVSGPEAANQAVPPSCTSGGGDVNYQLIVLVKVFGFDFGVVNLLNNFFLHK